MANEIPVAAVPVPVHPVPVEPVDPMDAAVPVPLRGLFAIYKSTWLEPLDNVTSYVRSFIENLGYSAVDGMLVKHGSYLNRTTGIIDGAVNLGDVIWTAGKGAVKATQEMVHG